ncbi:MAG: hypothetical protein JSW49_08785 [candidate division WOR-3 bacterium]|nr:MAG: hypothetical protein JSW49_08785 [candidate division WOR-3 bacterium]
MSEACLGVIRFLRAQLVAFIYSSIILLLVVLTGCVQYVKYVPDPEKDVYEWIANVSRQRSFSYEYETKMRSVSVKARGYCEVGMGERVSGSWLGAGETQDFEYIGLGHLEYTRGNGSWEKNSRGEQSDFLTQLSRILTTDRYEYQGFDHGYWYRFVANVPFLEPERRKEMIGLIKISDDDFLPSYVWAGLPDSSTFWSARVWGFNSRGRVKPPKKDRLDYLVTGALNNEGLRLLKKRLGILNIDYRIRRIKEGLHLSVPAHYGIGDIEALLRPGGMVLHAVATRAELACRVAYLGDDHNKPIFLSDSLMTEHDIRDVSVHFDQRSTPYLSLVLRKKRNLPSTMALLVDSILVATVTIDTLKRLNRIDLYPEMQYHEMEILRAYILQPLDTLRIIFSGGAIH